MSGGSVPGWPSCVSRCQALIIAGLFPRRKSATAGLEERGEREESQELFFQQLPGGLRLPLTLRMGG